MRTTDEDARLVALWQELQAAVVAGDERRLARLHARARGGEGREWEQLADEAQRHAAQLRAQREAEPGAAVGGGGAELLPPDELGDEVAGGGSPLKRAGSLIWLVLLLGYIALQFFAGGRDGG